MKTEKFVRAVTLILAMLLLWPGIAVAGIGVHLGAQSGSHSSTFFGISVSHGRFGNHGHLHGHHRFRKAHHFRRHRHGHIHRHYYRPHYWYSYRHYYGYPYYYPYGQVYMASHVGYGYVETDVTPGHAEVYIDGKYYGTAVEFNGSEGYEDRAEGRIALTPGTYELELRAAGYESYIYSVNVSPGETSVIIHDLDRY